MSKQAENMSAATDKGVLAYLDTRVQSASNRVNGYEQAQAVGHALTVACRELHEAKEARATVAELIEAAAAYRTATAMGMHLAASRKRLDAALARCGGAQ